MWWVRRVELDDMNPCFNLCLACFVWVFVVYVCEVYMCASVCIRLSMCVCEWVCEREMSKRVSVKECVRKCMWMSMYERVRMYVCMYVWVIVDAFRRCIVTPEFLSFLDDALPSLWGTSRSRGNREELLLQLFDIDEMTNILMFVLRPSGDATTAVHVQCVQTVSEIQTQSSGIRCATWKQDIVAFSLD